MAQQDNFNPWVQRATNLYREMHGVSFDPEYHDGKPTEPTPSITGQDGIFFGLLDVDTLKSHTRDASCNQEMRRHGFDPERGLEQVRFRRPLLAQAIKDCAIACKATGEPTISFWTEHCPEPRTTLLKMAPMEGGIGWVAIDVGRMATTVYELYSEEVFQAIALHNLG